MIDKFGITLVKRSFKKFGAEAKKILDQEADKAWKQCRMSTEGILERTPRSEIKICLALKQEIEGDQNIRAVGINCLNDSRFSDTTDGNPFLPSLSSNDRAQPHGHRDVVQGV